MWSDRFNALTIKAYRALDDKIVVAEPKASAYMERTRRWLANEAARDGLKPEAGGHGHVSTMGRRPGARGGFMKVFAVVVAGLLPVAAFAQETKTYTNADLAKFQVPGAYTNQDLKRLPPLPMQRGPVAKVQEYQAPEPPTAAFQAQYDNIRAERDLVQAQIDYEIKLVEFSESAAAGDTRSFDVRLGYRAPAAVWIRELESRKALLEAQMDLLAEGAYKSGAVLDKR